MRRISAIVVLACTASSAALAQSGAATKASAPACKVNTADAWVKRQAQWFDESKHEWTNDTLRTALLAAAGLQAPLTAPVQLGVHFAGQDPTLGASAETMIAELRKLAATRGSPWPTKSAVGPSATHAVYLLARRDTALGRVALRRMMEAGPDESPAPDVAALEDYLRLNWGRKQLYGTQFERDASGKISLRPMEDSAHADLRREGAGLPPFKLGLCFAKQ